MEASDFFVGSYFGAGHCYSSSENGFIFGNKPADNNNNGGNQFTIDDLLDFSKEDDEVMTDAFFDNLTAPATATNSADSSTVTVLDSCNSSNSGCEPHFSDASHFSNNNDELCVPYEELAELEWLSNFVEESFSSDDLHNLQLISATKAPTDTTSSSHATTPTVVSFQNTTSPPPAQILLPDVSVPGKARSKRSRSAPCDWSSRLLVLSPANSSSEDNDDKMKTATVAQSKKRVGVETPGRKCLHCASDKTPQWRTGPMGPKTLCNACGVRYKSGRLVPEYRPAASPTFVSTKHSNSHRKVLELRQQKELHRQQQQQLLLSQSSIFGEDCLVHHQNGTAFRHMI